MAGRDNVAAGRSGVMSPILSPTSPTGATAHGFLRAVSPSQRRVSGCSTRSEKRSSTAHAPTETQTQTQAQSQSVSSNANTATNEEAQRVVRTLPTWVRSFDEEDAAFDGLQRLLTPPQHVTIAQHHHSAQKGHHHQHAVPGSKHKTEPGRLFDFARQSTPVTINLPTREHASRWRPFVSATAYPVDQAQAGQQVTPAWLEKHVMPDLESPWHPHRPDDEDEFDERGKLLSSRKKRKAWWRRFHRSLVRNPIVPLVFRSTIFVFSTIALALGASIYAFSRRYAVPQRPSTLMAICFDSIALVYILYITYDEYSGKPLGLRSPAAKARLILLDLFFIIFNSANLSLAFDALTDVRWFCTTRYDHTTGPVPSLPGETPSQFNIKDPAICHRQRALTGVLLIALVAWLVTFNISVIRLVERVTRD